MQSERCLVAVSFLAYATIKTSDSYIQYILLLNGKLVREAFWEMAI